MRIFETPKPSSVLLAWPSTRAYLLLPLPVAPLSRTHAAASLPAVHGARGRTRAVVADNRGWPSLQEYPAFCVRFAAFHKKVRDENGKL